MTMKKYLYETMADCITQKINEDIWPVGMKLPGEKELTALLGGGHSTVREALDLCVERGLLQKKNGVGTFVVSKSVTLNNPLEQLNSVGDMIKAAGCEPESVHYSIRHCLPDRSIRDEFGLGKDELIVVMSRGRVANRMPVAFSVNVFPEKYVGDIFDEGIRGKIFDNLKGYADIDIRYSDTKIRGINPEHRWDRMACDFLKSPAVLLQQLHFDKNGEKIFYSYDYFNTDVMDLNMRRKI